MRILLITAAALAIIARPALAQIAPATTCDRAGIGSARLVADGPTVTITDAASGSTGGGAAAIPYCLVKVLVPEAINIWVGLPMDGRWKGLMMAQRYPDDYDGIVAGAPAIHWDRFQGGADLAAGRNAA